MTTRRRSTPVSAGLCLGGAALALAGCGLGTSASSVETADTSSRLPAGCQDVSTTVHQENCLDAVQQTLQSHAAAYAAGSTVTHTAFRQAYDPLSRAWAAELTDGHSVSLDTRLGDGPAEEKATTPIKTTWALGGVSRTLWTCFQGKSVTVQTATCAT